MFNFLKRLISNKDTRMPATGSQVADLAPPDADIKPSSRTIEEELLPIPVKVLIGALPPEAKKGARNLPDPLKIPTRIIVPQLARGKVLLTRQDLESFGVQDASILNYAPITLPLKEVIARLNPQHLKHRPDQKSLGLPQDQEIRPLFRLAEKGSAAGKPSAPAPAPEPARKEAVAPAPISVSASSPVAAPEPAPAPIPMPARIPAPSPVISFASETAPADADSVALPGETVSASFSEKVRREFFGNPSAELRIPFADLLPHLNRGKIEVRAETLRGWIHPSPPPGADISEVIQVPLAAVVPKVLSRLPHPPGQRIVQPSENIPPLFTHVRRGAPKVETAPAAPVPSGPAAKPRDQTLSQLFGSAPRSYSIKEALGEAAKWPGVRGVLITTADGLPLAQVLPDGIGAEAAAAFIPQLASRTRQLAKELRAPDFSCVRIQLGAVMLVIFPCGQGQLAVVGDRLDSVDEQRFGKLAELLADGR